MNKKQNPIKSVVKVIGSCRVFITEPNKEMSDTGEQPAIQQSVLPAQPGENSNEEIIEAYRLDCETGKIHAIAALRFGLMLREKRAHILNKSPSSNNWKTGRFEEKKDGGFMDYLDTMGIPRSTAYQRIEIAARLLVKVLAEAHLGIYKDPNSFIGGKGSEEDIPLTINCESRVISLSECVHSSPEKLSGEALKLKQALLETIGDKTLAEALRGSISGESDMARFDRAYNGKKRGGTNKFDDRKDYPFFIGELLKKLSGHLAHWETMMTELQRSETEQVFRAAILGHRTTLPRKASKLFLYNKIWPEELCKIIQAVCKQAANEGSEGVKDAD